MIDIYKAGGIIIKERKLLVTRSRGKDFFVAPGGKIEGAETSRQALVRELKEELEITITEENLIEFGTFLATATGENDKQIKMEVFLVKNWAGEINPSNEVEEVCWINSWSNDIILGSIFAHEVIPKLKENNLID